MSIILQQTPKNAMEVFKILPEGTLCEVINGVLYTSPSTLTEHQRIVSKLTSIFYNHFDEHHTGECFAAPFDVYLDNESNAVQPDVIIVLNENASIVKEHIYGVPDILIEVLSKGNESHDLVKKKLLYEQKGVKEYFIIQPKTKEVIHYHYVNGTYTLLPAKNGELKSAVLNAVFNF
jgi:Uma2 family endonuclease